MKASTSLNTLSLRHFGIGIATMLIMASRANAHHAMDGQTPVTFAQGFMSGLAHPVIGLDHLMYLLIAAVLAFTLNGVARYLVPMLFVIATLGGTVFHIGAGNIPFVETLVALSVLLAGIIAFAKKSPAALVLAVVFAVSGIFHGYAYGEAIIGAETGPLLAYLIGFAMIQYLIIAGGIRALELITTRSEGLQSLVTKLSSSVAILSGSIFVVLSMA